ncbi:MAG: PD-(D/E)XK nuclease family protein [Spirochaetales bacterium]|nr:PD-(D/E)XK nuclease family protein [Spirochaetales bacterium]
MSDDFDKDIEEFIENRFYDNLAVIETENKLRINSFVKEQALLQVKMYWEKLKELAKKVTQSEVPITLSNQTTPKGRNYTIRGVVDIIKEDNETILYDIKTHDPDFVRHNKENYEKQLNIYGSIWERINQKPLDRTAVIATPLPAKLRWALHEGTQAQIRNAVTEWEPVIPMEYNKNARDGTLEEFGEIVDNIQDCKFAPPPVVVLKTKMAGGKTIFARKICHNCDIRFACDSYREYSIGRRTLSTDDLIYLIKDMGNDRDNLTFKNISFEADVQKEFEASTEQVEDITEQEFEE